MKNLFLVFLVMAAMTGCKKSTVVNQTPVTKTAKKLMKTTDIFDNGQAEVNEYIYDAQGVISKAKENGRTYTFNFMSATSLLVTATNNADNSLFRTYECVLNDKGYLTKMVQKNPAGALYYTYDYTYDGNGYMTRQKGTFPNGGSSEFVYTVVNGNLVNTKLYYDNVLNNTTEFTVDNTKLNITKFGLGWYWPVQNLFGKGSKYLIAENKVFNTAGVLTWHAQHSYELDKDGYPVKQTTDYPLNGKQGIVTSVYQ